LFSHFYLHEGKESDLVFIENLSRRVFSVYGPYDRILPIRFTDPTVSTIVAEIEGEKSGFAMLEILRGYNASPIWGELIAIAVEPDHQRKGIGKSLLVEMECLASSYGLRYLNLHVAEGNHRAMSFFQKNGYRIIHSIDNYYPHGQKGFLMARPIAQLY
jgi:ribosomal protein S18 acetylase RimI-like enzyme